MTFLAAQQQIEIAGMAVQLCRYTISDYQPALAEQLGLLLPESIRRAVSKRQAEFVAGRFLAALAMAPFGHARADVTIGPDRCPQWPAGLVGSISHSQQYAACCVGVAEVLPYIGIDIEERSSADHCAELYPMLANADEQALLAAAGLAQAEAALLCFSAKESFFKAVYPHIRRYLEFDEPEIVAVNAEQLVIELPAGKVAGIEEAYRLTVVAHWLDDALITLAR